MKDVRCTFCDHAATHIAAQSADAGKTVTWVPICKMEVKGWNEGGDWDAPIFELGERYEALPEQDPFGPDTGGQYKMKTTEEIAADCGLHENEAHCLHRLLDENGPTTAELVYANIISALYRRIEALETVNQLIERMEQIAADTKKAIEFDKSTGDWLWRDRDEHDPAGWHSGFKTRVEALREAVEPYLEDEVTECALCQKKIFLQDSYSPGDEAICAECDTEVTGRKHSPSLPVESNWSNDAIQFPRLIEEAQAAGAFTPDVIAFMSESMDLDTAQIHGLLERAQEKWDRIKSKTRVAKGEYDQVLEDWTARHPRIKSEPPPPR